ncbi:MAG TPA: FIST N-terminal domain-containing protein [Verrucomicrobiae bacterium]|nr:FIST N-terminal domain-containing protein [Verrucomicrobiae bacterium]
MQEKHAVVAYWPRGFDEEGLQAWAQDLRERLRAPRVSLGLVFMSPRFFPNAEQVLEILRVHAQIPLLAGCSSESLIAGAKEMEHNAGLVLALYALPDAELKAVHFTQQNVEAAIGPDHWPAVTGVSATKSNGWLVFMDPFHLDSETWLKTWNESYGAIPALGGLASGPLDEQVTQLYLNGEVFEEGGVAISVGGAVGLAGIVSQGCMPIGDPWTLTRVEGNVIHRIGNRPAYEVLAETFAQLATSDQRKARGNLFIGLVMNEYQEEFHQGDFLVRQLLVADPQSGAIAVGALPRTGQTVQFQRRDAAAANDDLLALLKKFTSEAAGTTIYGGCLCCCNGRGRGLFGTPDHDARLVQEHLGPIGISGFFCNGEIGPVGQHNYLHGYTASLALFVKK